MLLLVFGLLAASLFVISTKPTKLGLDLQGGVELVYQAEPTPQQPTIDNEAMNRTLEIMRERVDALGVSEPELQRSGEDQISVGLPDVSNAKRAEEQVGKVAQLYLYDWEKNVLGKDGKPDPENPAVTETPITGLYNAVKIAAKRPAQKDDNNTAGAQYYLFGKDKLHKLIAGPAGSEADLVGELTESQKGTVAQRKAAAQKIVDEGEIIKVNPGTLVIEATANEKDADKGGRTFDKWYVINDNPELSGRDLKNPKQAFDSGGGGSGEPIVTFEFTDKGRKQFQDVTRRLAERGLSQQVPGVDPQQAFQNFAIVLDGKLVSRPYIDFQQNPDGIDGRTGAQISGGFTVESAQDLSKFLQIGALPVKLKLISQSQVSATLGKQALDQGLVAGLVGFGLTALLLICLYRILGLIAVGTLVVYACYLFALIKLIPVTLTLPGIAGLVLTIGVAADANIVIFERIKEEVRRGKSVRAGIASGYKKGLSAIIDANVVTLLVAFILFMLATAGVKGFALILGLGTIISLFTAVLATQAILGTLGDTKTLARPSALGAAKQRFKFQLNFMGAARWFFSMSGVILLIGALALGANGINFGIDFESGTRVKVAVEKSVSENEVRDVMNEAGFEKTKIQKVDEPALGANVFQISTTELQPQQVSKVREQLDKRIGIGEGGFSNESIGPTFGATIAEGAAIAIIACLLVISGYIALRFEWKFAVPVLIAVMHDILIAAGVYALIGAEVTAATVAAFLTILGYSLYDTIIVLDRIRENAPRMPRAAFSQIVNRSMSEVITRSLATSLCTLLPILALLFFGGETLQDFAIALTVGVVSGTYSSIFIASPLLDLWKSRERPYRLREARIIRENGFVPAYQTETIGGEALAGEVVETASDRRKRERASKRSGLSSDQAGDVSPEEFQEMVEDLGTDAPREEKPPEPKKADVVSNPSERKATQTDPMAREPDASPDDLAGKDPNKDKRKKRGPKRKHGRSR